MKRHAPARGLAVAASSFLFFEYVAAEPSIAVAYCASINTASSEANSSTYQSEGLCYDYCNDDGYALGVLQDKDCWCSNYVPDSGDQVDSSECDSSCPGYPDDYCGGSGLYGYIQLSAAVSGTSGGDSSTAAATSTSSSNIVITSTEVQTSIRIETETETVQDSVTTTSSSAPLTTSTSLTSSTKSTETTTSSQTTTTAKTTTTSSSSDAEPTTSTSSTSSDDHTNPATKTTITSVQTVTSAGSVIVQTVTTVADASNQGSGGLSKGAVAGLVIGILAAIAAFVVGAILYRRHKRNQQLQEQTPLAGGDGSHRRGSSAGIMSKTGTMSSSGYGFDMMEDNGYGSPGRRVSMKPMDPRLDPKSAYGLYRAASHDSINTIRDDQDYSRRVHEPPRMLRVMNAHPGDD